MSRQGFQSPPSGEAARRHALWSVRTQLLLTVGLILAAGLAVILVLDYRNERADRLRQKRVALQEEAQILLPAVQRLAPDLQAVQEYLDVACGKMQETTSPGHHIAVRLGETVLQAHSHGRASPQMLQAMQDAAGNADRQATVDGRRLLVGSDADGGTAVYVSEYVSNVLAASRRHFLWRATQIAALGLTAAAVTGLVLVRVVTQPIRRLVSTVRQIGQGWIGVKVSRFSTSELQFLADEVNAMSESLADADARRVRDLEKARRIQQNLLPKATAPAGWHVVPLYRPAEAVGGDFYDFTLTAQNRLVSCIADVTGHGISAALGAAMLKVLFTAAVRESDDPGEIIRSIDRGFTSISLDEQFASMAVVTMDPEGRRLRWASAGHESGILLRCDHAPQLLPSTGPLLGISLACEWATTELGLLAGDRLVLATDGWVESAAENGQMLGRDRFLELVQASAVATPQDAVHWLLNELSDWSGSVPQNDDMTLLILEWSAAQEQEIHAPAEHRRLAGTTGAVARDAPANLDNAEARPRCAPSS